MKEISSLRVKTPGIYRLKRDLRAYKKVRGQWEETVLSRGTQVTRSTHCLLIGGGSAYINAAGVQSYGTVEVKRRG